MASLKRSISLTLLGVFIIANSIKAQDLSAEQQKRVQQLTKNLQEALKQDNYSSAASYSGKMGYIYWNSGFYNKAIENFNDALEFNSKVGNRNGIKTIRYNLGLIYSEQEQYQQAINQFNKGIQ